MKSTHSSRDRLRGPPNLKCGSVLLRWWIDLLPPGRYSSSLAIFSPGPVLNYRSTAFLSSLRFLLLLFSQTDIRSPGALRLSLLAFRGRLPFRFLLL